MRIKVNIFFILFLFIAVYFGYAKEISVIFFSVLLHELGHVAFALKLKVFVEEIELFPFGGIARIENISKFGGYTEAKISAAGPLISGIIALICFFSPFKSSYIELFFKYNFALFVFNILPALPLDGGRIARNFLIIYKSYRSSTRLMIISGQVLAILLVLYNIYIIQKGEISIAYIAAAMFIFFGTIKERSFCSYMYLLNRNNKKKFQLEQNKINKRYINANSNTLLRTVAEGFSPASFCIVNVFDDSGKIIAKLDESDIMSGLIYYGYDSILRDIIKK